MPSRREAKILRALGRRKGREEHGLFLAEGPHLARELVESELPVAMVLHTPDYPSDRAERETLEALRDRGAELREVDPGTLAEFADTVTPQGVLSVARVPRRELEELPADGLLVFDSIQDPGNFGTLVRTAEAMGMAGVLALRGTVDAWNPKAVRAAAGSSFRLPIAAASWPAAREFLRGRDAAVWAADPLGEPLYGGEPAPDRLALVLGNEGRGVSGEVLDDADRRVRVPTSGAVESLNVAVAGALLVDRVFGLRARGGSRAR